jgi:hypothetical protein
MLGQENKFSPVLVKLKIGHETGHYGALLPLLRVKRGPFSLHILNQFFDTIKGWLIRHAGRH